MSSKASRQAPEELLDLLAAASTEASSSHSPPGLNSISGSQIASMRLDAGLAVAGPVEGSQQRGQVAHVGEYAAPGARIAP